MAQRLIDLGASLKIRCRWTNMTPLHYASYFDVSPVLKTLLKASKVCKVCSKISKKVEKIREITFYKKKKSAKKCNYDESKQHCLPQINVVCFEQRARS